jgi:hypothetical protein
MCLGNASYAQKTKSFDAPFNLWKFPIARIPEYAKTVSITCDSKA